MVPEEFLEKAREVLPDIATAPIGETIVVPGIMEFGGETMGCQFIATPSGWEFVKIKLLGLTREERLQLEEILARNEQQEENV